MSDEAPAALFDRDTLASVAKDAVMQFFARIDRGYEITITVFGVTITVKAKPEEK